MKKKLLLVKVILTDTALPIVVYFNAMVIMYPKHTINHNIFESNLKFRKCI